MVIPRRISMSLALAVTVLMVATQGCSRQNRLADSGLVFYVTADMRGYTMPEFNGPDHFAGACMAIDELGKGSFMVSPGDIDPPDRVRLTLDSVLGKEYVWYPVVGNHELDDPHHIEYLRVYNKGGNSLPEITRIGPPGAEETCYAFEYGDVHCTVINQYYDGEKDDALDGDVADPLYSWLKQDLMENTKPVAVVFGHEPVVSMPDMGNGRVRHRGDSLDKYPESNHRFWSLLKDTGVLAYFCGHTHNTSVSKINGVWQIDCGHARGIGDKGAASSFVRMQVDADSVVCELYRDNAQGGEYKMVYRERLR